ncbi:Uncharacterised protein [uncultured archaeon]|nr:Uncharacterised protein [uncultured archaeon]
MQGPRSKLLLKSYRKPFRDPILKKIRNQFKNREYKKLPYCSRCDNDEYFRFLGLRERTFCQVITNEGDFEKIQLKVARYRCNKHCRKIFIASDAPFYSNCRYGKQIVDLCRFLAKEHPVLEIERTLANIAGIQIDRDTIRRYITKFKVTIGPHKNKKCYTDFIPIIEKFLFNDDTKRKFPMGRKSWTKHLYESKSIDIPKPLFDALREYGKKNDITLQEAIQELKRVWDSGNKQEFENILIYNPPPDSKEHIRPRFQVDKSQFEFIEDILKEKNRYCDNPTDFIRRALTWYMREKGYLPKKK